MSLFYREPAHKLLYGLASRQLEAALYGAVTNASYWGIINNAQIEMAEYTGKCGRSQMRQLYKMWNTTQIEWWQTPEVVEGSWEPGQLPYNWVKKSSVIPLWYAFFFTQLYGN